MYIRAAIFLSMAFTSLLAGTVQVSANIPDHFVLGSAAFATPQGRFADRLTLPGAVAFSLGYLYSPSRTIWMGAAGHWMHFPEDGREPVNDSTPPAASTVLQMTSVARLRMFKHGFTPYLDVEAGMCYLSYRDAVRPCLAAAIGTQIPLSDRVDLDLRIRTSWAPQASDELLVGALHVGLVYALK
jgi:hypothetical protein